MKYYLFLTTFIRGIGGGHIYTVNKMVFLREKGYDVGFFHGDVKFGKLEIEALKPYLQNGDNHLQYPAYYFSKKIQERVLASICEAIPQNCTEVVIESQTISCSTWAELIAARVGAKHLAYLLGENVNIRTRELYRFFKFKLDRRELAGIGEKTLPMLFEGWQRVPASERYFLRAYSSNVVADVPYLSLRDIPQSDVVIGSIGRLDKLTLLESLNDIFAFANANIDKTITLLLIGGGTDKTIKDIRKRFKNTPNVRLHITGNIYPIPLELLMLPDVFVSAAGSCRVSSELGKLTISMDVNDLKPIGIVGITTDNTLFRKREPVVRLVDWFDAILIKKEYKSEISIPKDILKKYDYSSHLEFLTQGSSTKEFFDISHSRLSFRDFFEKAFIVLLGIDLYFKLKQRVISPVWMKLKSHTN